MQMVAVAKISIGDSTWRYVSAKPVIHIFVHEKMLYKRGLYTNVIETVRPNYYKIVKEMWYISNMALYYSSYCSSFGRHMQQKSSKPLFLKPTCRSLLLKSDG